MSILTVTCYGIEFSWEFCFPFGPMATFVRRLKVKYGLFSFKRTLLKFYFLTLLILYFFRICRLPHFHGFIFIFVYFIERKKTNTIFVWFLYEIQNKDTSAKIHLNHFYIIKYFLYSLLMSDFSHSENPTHQKFQSIHRTNIFSRIFQRFYIPANFTWINEKTTIILSHWH